MARINHRNQEPPGGWRFFEIRTKLMMKDTSIELLTKQVIEHRKYKELGPIDAESVGLEIERQICARLNTHHCTAEGSDDDWVPIDDRAGAMFSVAAIMGFSKASLDWVSKGGAVVDRETLDKRHGICAGCPLNNMASGCSVCSMFYNTVNAVVPKERKFDDLHVCSACGCAINAKIQLPVAALEEFDRDRNISYPSWCWMNPKSPAYS